MHVKSWQINNTCLLSFSYYIQFSRASCNTSDKQYLYIDSIVYFKSEHQSSVNDVTVCVLDTVTGCTELIFPINLKVATRTDV